jgi:hypothetical protein
LRLIIESSAAFFWRAAYLMNFLAVKCRQENALSGHFHGNVQRATARDDV